MTEESCGDTKKIDRAVIILADREAANHAITSLHEVWKKRATPMVRVIGMPYWVRGIDIRTNSVYIERVLLWPGIRPSVYRGFRPDIIFPGVSTKDDYLARVQAEWPSAMVMMPVPAPVDLPGSPFVVTWDAFYKYI